MDKKNLNDMGTHSKKYFTKHFSRHDLMHKIKIEVSKLVTLSQNENNAIQFFW